MQVVLAQDFSQDFQNDPFDLYRALRQLNPSPYMYYLDLEFKLSLCNEAIDLDYKYRA